MRPLVCDYLLTHSLQELQDEHGVYASYSKNFDRLSLNYDQFDAKSGEKLSGECRGLILRIVNGQKEHDRCVGETEVLSWPFNRFYNFGDPSAANVDLRSAVVFEKLDGTMIGMYHDGEKWCASTRSVPMADQPIMSTHALTGDLTFSELFFTTFAQQGMSLVDFDKRFTYVFELTSPMNQVVVSHERSSVTLLGSRETKTGIESPINPDKYRCVKVPQIFSLSTLDDCVKFVNDADGKKFEGVVVVDKSFNRIKIKNKDYILSSKMSDIFSSKRNVFKIILEEKHDDVLPLLNDAQTEFLNSMLKSFHVFMTQIDKRFETIKTFSRKEFAISIKDEPWQAPFFLLYDNVAPTAWKCVVNANSKKSLSDKTIDTILKLLC